MGAYYIYIPNCVRKTVRRFPKEWQLKIFEKIWEIEIRPSIGVPMQGKYSDRRKIIVWPYRILYKVNELKRVVEIVEIESRGNMSYDR